MMKILAKSFCVVLSLLCLFLSAVLAEDRHWGWLGPVDDLADAVIAVDPTEPQIVYVGTRDSGLFKSTDGGNRWSRLGNQLELSRASALAINPSSPQIIYAGEYRNINKSTDGGASWTRLDLGWDGGDSLGNVLAIAIDPAFPQTIYAAASSHIFKSVDGGTTWKKILTRIDHFSSLAIALKRRRRYTPVLSAVCLRV